MLVTPGQNTPERGYGRVRAENPVLAAWAKFYGLPEDDRWQSLIYFNLYFIFNAILQSCLNKLLIFSGRPYFPSFEEIKSMDPEEFMRRVWSTFLPLPLSSLSSFHNLFRTNVTSSSIRNCTYFHRAGFVQTYGMYFNSNVYKKRIRAVLRPFLLDAKARATNEGKEAVVRITGLGLGVWKLCEEQVRCVV